MVCVCVCGVFVCVCVGLYVCGVCTFDVSVCGFFMCVRGGTPPKNKTSLNAAERGGVGEGQRQCLFPRPSTINSETDVFL